jgi:hypothetical protein
MKAQSSRKPIILVLLLLGFLSGCESTDSGGGSVSGGVYYGMGFYDPWYYGGYHTDIIVTPPPSGSGPDSPPRPAHPIATPPASAARPTPMPSIPSAPRASFRR